MNSKTILEGENLLTVPQVAERLHLAEQGVWRFVWNGTIPSVKFGRARRILPEDLAQFIEASRAAPQRN
jgi:excisionase family DNA binding protein